MCYRCGTGVQLCNTCAAGAAGVPKENISGMNVWHEINKDNVLSDVTCGPFWHETNKDNVLSDVTCGPFVLRKYICATSVPYLPVYVQTDMGAPCCSIDCIIGILHTTPITIKK